MGFQSIAFVITPDELKNALYPFTLFICNSHVPIDYKYTPQSDFIYNYTELYYKLCKGEKINHRKDFNLLKYYSITTNINSVQFGDKHLYDGNEYMRYIGSNRGYAPYFSPFTFGVYVEHNKVYVTTRGSWEVDYTDIMGFQLLFPKLTNNEAQLYNIQSERDWDSYSDYILFRNYIIDHTSAFIFSLNGQKKKTMIRVSDKVKSVISEFDCIKKNALVVL